MRRAGVKRQVREYRTILTACSHLSSHKGDDSCPLLWARILTLHKLTLVLVPCVMKPQSRRYRLELTLAHDDIGSGRRFIFSRSTPPKPRDTQPLCLSGPPCVVQVHPMYLSGGLGRVPRSSGCRFGCCQPESAQCQCVITQSAFLAVIVWELCIHRALQPVYMRRDERRLSTQISPFDTLSVSKPD